MDEIKQTQPANQSNPVSHYETRSLDELAVLLALGAEVVKVDRVSDPRFYKFYLEGEQDLERQALSFTSRKLMVNAADLLDARRRANSIVHASK